MVSFYDLLGLNQGASEEEIRAKLKEKKRLWTQRQNAPKPEQQQEASNNLRMVPEIEATLLNSQKRSAYDQQLRSTPKETAEVDTSKIGADELVQEGWNLLAAGNVPDALMVATKATEVQGNNPDAWALLGYCRAQWGEIEDAIYEYKRAIKLRPNDASFYYDLGAIYETSEQWKDAMQQYERAAQIDPSKAVYRAAMGGVYMKNEMYQEGIDLLEQCVKDEPDSEDYKYLLAIAYAESAYQNWTLVGEGGNAPPGYYATTNEHVSQAELLIQKAEDTGVSDTDVRQRLQEIRTNIAAMRKRKFNGNYLAIGGAIALGLYAMSQDDAPAGLGIYLVVFSILYAISCMTPQYKLNKRIIESGGGTSAGAMLEGFSEGFGVGCFTMLISFAFIIALLPIMTVWNLVKNYATK